MTAGARRTTTGPARPTSSPARPTSSPALDTVFGPVRAPTAFEETVERLGGIQCPAAKVV